MRSWFVALLASGLCSCSERPAPPAPVGNAEASVQAPARAEAQALEASDASAASTAVAVAAADAGPAGEKSAQVRDAWPRVALDDAARLCLFPGFKERVAAPFRHQAGKKQKLRAGASVVVGAYAPPACVNELCDTGPTLQCWVEQAGDILTVHSRYRARHKPDSQCTENCREVTAGCETPKLAAGTYTLKHGDKSIALKIPSVLRSSCLPGD